MNKKYYIIGGVIIFLLIVALGVYFTSGGNKPKPSDEQIELTWWKTFEDSQYISVLIDEYQNTHQNVRINYVKKDAGDYELDLLDAIASGSGPDIFSIHNDWLPKHSQKIIPIPETIMSLREYKDSFVDVAYGDFVKDNKIYAVPLAVDVLALYYNKDILGSAGISQPPRTWPELVSDVQKITKVSKNGVFSRSGIAMGTANNVNRSVDILSLIMLQNGTKFYSDDFTTASFDQTQNTSGAVNFSPGARALAYYTQFANPANVAYTWNVKSDFSVDAFTQGKVAMMINYQYMEPLIKAKSPTLNWEVAAIPQISEEATKINFANYWGEAISKNSKNQLAAADFLKFISSREVLSKYYSSPRKVVSSRKDLIPAQKGDTEIGVFADGALTARSVFKKDADDYEGVFLKMINDVILNNFEVEDALRNGVQQINFSLQKQ
ncbi:MAG: extracellular solute-binding protein [Candidatus Doudnabacteria bacterium]|nr:extracellular solute-binding protein [Candidatus Doudnabacteria bacterium]